MNELNLQKFAAVEAVSGKNIIYLYRILKDAATKGGTTLAFVTENSRKKSKSADSTMTKDGAIRTPGASEGEITCSSLLRKGDTFIDDLEDAQDNDELIEIWEVNLGEKASLGDNKFKGRYFQGYLTELEKSSKSDENVEISLTFGINGTGAKGDVTVTEEQQEIATYVFQDDVKTGA